MQEADFHELISGKRSGVIGNLGRFLLRLACPFYGLAIWLRNLGYHLGILKVRKAALPVISVGNITTGGTGKTPFVAWVCRWFREQESRVCIVSRGYGAQSGQQNDEALVLEQLCPDVPLLQDADRYRGAETARIELASQLIVLDDGFQHRRIARELDIVLIDACNPFGYGHLLPRGLMREPVTAIRRAQVLVITRIDQVDTSQIDTLVETLRRTHPSAPICLARFPAQKLIASNNSTEPIDTITGKKVAAFCGIGNPAAFESSLRNLGCELVGIMTFPDHHLYSRLDVERLASWTKQCKPDWFVTTQKDLVKLQTTSIGGTPLWAVEIGTEIVQGERELTDQLRKVLVHIPPDIEWTESTGY